MWHRFQKFADEIMPVVDNPLKLFRVIIGVLVAAFMAGVLSQKYLIAPALQHSDTMWANVTAGTSQVCNALSEITRVQSAYDARVKPIQERWLQLTEEFERGNLLPSERDKVAETVDLVRKEMERTQAEHRKIVDGIIQSCQRN